MHAALVARPGSCIRQLAQCSRAREIQFTRFLRNDAVTAEEIAAYAAERTAARARGRDVVVVQDTSELSLGGRRAKANGYGPIGKGGALRGLLLHAALAVDASNGGVIGLVDAKVWNRTGGKAKHRRARTTKQKESQRWLDSTRRAAEVLAEAASITVVSDRESDIYAHFAFRPQTTHLIVRACQNRRIEEEQIDLLFSHIDSLPEAGRLKVNIPAAPGRKARSSELAIRFSRVTLRKPLHGTADLPDTVTLAVVDVRETSTPEGGKPIHWRLLTTHPVTNIADARRTVDLYRMRWVVEEYFHTQKTGGFDIEAADISDPEAMIRFAAVVAVAAVSVMQLVKARDGTTGQNLLEAFEPADQPILEAVSAKLEGKTERQKNAHPKGSLAFAAWVIARLGGWDGYYGKPGPKTMRLGLEAFQRIKFGTSLALRDV
ncbi:IS4 family transposase [Bradyrhizobium sp. Arg237L]|nr:IS4 family transposase [Bradyrhizobium sp. Arg237L]MDI4239519.1 IS4 family transposase [Bradyrhizobium sp. Arg237L]